MDNSEPIDIYTNSVNYAIAEQTLGYLILNAIKSFPPTKQDLTQTPS